LRIPSTSSSTNSDDASGGSFDRQGRQTSTVYQISRSCRRALLNSTIPCRESSHLQLLTMTKCSTNRTSVVKLLRDQTLVEMYAPVRQILHTPIDSHGARLMILKVCANRPIMFANFRLGFCICSLRCTLFVGTQGSHMVKFNSIPDLTPR
jgi:hypothetical protein